MRLLPFIVSCILLSSFVFSSSSENFENTLVITNGGEEISSSSYDQTVVVGIIGGTLNSSAYSSEIGFLHTLRATDGQPCNQDTQCEGSFCCSEVCQNSVCIVLSSGGGSSGGGSSSSGGSSGGGGGGILIPQPLKTTSAQNFSISPQLLRFHISLGETNSSNLTFMNLGNSKLNVNLSIEGIQDILTLSNYSLKNFNTTTGQTIIVTALGRKLGSHYGNIIASSSNFTRTLDVLVDVESNQALFDVQLDIPEQFKWLSKNEQPRAQLTLFNIGSASQVEVSITYLIKDGKGNTYSEESETITVEKEKSFVHEFSTNSLEVGKYIAISEVRYQGEFAVSSDIFQVTEKSSLNLIKEISSSNFTFFAALLTISVVSYIALGYFSSKQARQKVEQKKKRIK